MDRNWTSKSEHRPTMCDCRSVPLGALLRTPRRDRRESATDAASGRAIYEDAILWRSQNASVSDPAGLRSQSEAGKAASPANGTGGNLCKAAIVETRARPSNIPLSIERAAHCPAQSGMGNRYNLYPDATRICVSGGDHGLVQPLCSLMGIVRQPGHELLYHGIGMGHENRKARDLQFGSGIPVHQRIVHKLAVSRQNRHQHGWPRPGIGQCLRRAPLANSEIRRGLSEGLHECRRGIRKSSSIFSVLQSRTCSSILGLSDSRRDLFQQGGLNAICWETIHDNDRVSGRSLIAGQYRAEISCGNPVKQKIWENEPIESLEKPRGFSNDSIGSTSVFFNNHGSQIRGNDPP